MFKLIALVGVMLLLRPRPMETTMSESKEVDKRGYWCLACGRYIEATETDDGRFVILHDKDVDHSFMTYDEEDHPQ